MDSYLTPYDIERLKMQSTTSYLSVHITDTTAVNNSFFLTNTVFHGHQSQIVRLIVIVSLFDVLQTVPYSKVPKKW